MEDSGKKGIIGKLEEEGMPVIFRLADELPVLETRNRFCWLTVISWKYDRTVRNGMPAPETNQDMLALECAMDRLEESMLCRHAYSRTGNGLKEFAYYISDRETFMGQFNAVLRHHPQYPIEIDFYEDPEWAEFEEVRALFTGPR